MAGSDAVDSTMALIEWRGENIGTGELGEKEGGEVFECCGVPVNDLIRGLI